MGIEQRNTQLVNNQRIRTLNSENAKASVSFVTAIIVESAGTHLDVENGPKLLPLLKRRVLLAWKTEEGFQVELESIN